MTFGGFSSATQRTLPLRFLRTSLTLFLSYDRTLLNATPPKSQLHLPSNLLSILVRLSTFPTEQSELNAWWVPELGIKPPKPKYVKKKSSPGGIAINEPDDDDDDEVMEDREANQDEADDWRKFFDEPSPNEASAGSSQSRARLHTLTIHQSLHSLASHRAVFTRAWLTLLPRLTVQNDTSTSKELVLRALNVMHRGVLPHLTRAILVMDWVGSCVDYGETSISTFDGIIPDIIVSFTSPGGAVGLLAFNALFVLMKNYNLYVKPEQRVRKITS